MSEGSVSISERWPLVDVIRFGYEDNVVEAGNTRLRILHTPGHSPDHLCFLDEESRDLYCGDLARAGGSIVIPASKGGNLRQYLDSLRRIRALEPRRLLPGHGPIVDDPAALIDDYLRHRQQREDEIVAALSDWTENARGDRAAGLRSIESDAERQRRPTVCSRTW